MPLSELINTNRAQTSNQSVTPLAGAASFNLAHAISGYVATSGFARITGTVFADQAGTLNVYQSSDGVNDDWLDTVAVVASTKTKFSFEVIAPNFYVSYTNGATPNTVFRLYTTLRRV